MMLLAIHGGAVAVVSVAPLLAFRVFLDGDRVVWLAVFAKLDVGQTLAMAFARMRRLRAVRHRMLTELPGRQHGRFRLLCRRRQQDAKKSQRSPCHRVGVFIVRTGVATGVSTRLITAFRGFVDFAAAVPSEPPM